MIANNTQDLRTGRSAELVESLRRTVTETAEREEELMRDLRSARFLSQRKHEEAAKRLEEEIGKSNDSSDGGFMRRWDRLRTLYENRYSKLEAGKQSRLREMPRLVEAERGSFLGKLQQKKLRLEKELHAGLEALKLKGEEANVSLTAQTERVDALYDRAWAASGGIPGLRAKLAATRAAAAERANDAGETVDPAPHLAAAEERMLALEASGLARLLRHTPGSVPPVVAAFIGAGIVMALRLDTVPAVFLCLGLASGAVLLQLIAAAAVRPVALPLFASLASARSACIAGRLRQERSYESGAAALREAHDAAAAAVQVDWSGVDSVAKAYEEKETLRMTERLPKVMRRLEDLLDKKRRLLEYEHSTAANRAQTGNQTKLDRLRDERAAETAAFDAGAEARWSALENEWKSRVGSLRHSAEADAADAARRFPAWDAVDPDAWRPAVAFPPAVKFGELRADFSRCVPARPKTARLAEASPDTLTQPLTLSFPAEGSLFMDTEEAGDASAAAAFNNIILRSLLITPPGKAAFTIIDPVGLGQNFAGLMHLADYEESLINRRIWTQRDQIDERLAELSEHIEKVIQMYLRNEYATITEYNAHAGSVAEKYHFLVISDFPANFSETAVKRLQSIVASGPRCGVFTLLHRDRRIPAPDGFVTEEVRRNALTLLREGGRWILAGGPSGEGVDVNLDPPPSPEKELRLVQAIGKASIDSNRVEVPFSHISPAPEDIWTGDTTSELRVAIGRTGATKHQMLAIGKGTRQHALFAGKTGSGKSTLFHVIITNLALNCSPDQVEFYLIDFKKGVEFKCYANKRLPHAKVVAIESDREFALSVLQRVDVELKRRGDMFRALGVQDIAGYKRAGGTEAIPRTLLIIDEFQEFFVEDDTVAQTASLLFDRIVRQGRAFGIHVLLGSQTLGGAYSLARATIGQMVIRVALQCNEADAYLIMDDNNPAPRLLSRPGEGIYNDAAGALEGNSPFQVVWLPDDERDDLLEDLRRRADATSSDWRGPIVFEGNAPANVAENHQLTAALASSPVGAPEAARAWLGAPNSIKGPTEAVFRAQSGSHLLVVGQREEATLTMLGLALLSLGAQHGPGSAKFILAHSAAPGSSDEAFLQRVISAIPHEVHQPRPHELPETLRQLAAEVKSRAAGEGDPGEAPPVFLLIHGVHKHKKLRQEDDFSFSLDDDAGGPKPAADFATLVTEGSSAGVHLLVSLDTYNNVNRWLNRKALSEFEMRVVFQMSANDSAALIDSTQAADLGLHRALYYNEHEGSLETFRPYSAPEASFFPAPVAMA